MDKKVRLGVIGLGGMGYSHCTGVKDIAEFQLAAVCDNDPKTAEQRGTELKVPWFSDYRALITGGLVDAVLIATPHWFHPDIAVTAFQNGLHVLSEKPIAVTVSDADRMVKAAKKSRKIFSAMYQRRTEPAMRKAREIIESGALGELYRTLCIHPWYRTQAYYDSGPWRATWKGEGGGVLINQAPHGIDLFLLFGGMPSKITAKTRTRLHTIEVEDEVAAELEYPNGAWGYFYTSTCEAVNILTMEFCGVKGKLLVSDTAVRLWTYPENLADFARTSTDIWTTMKPEEIPVELPVDAPGGHAEILRNFARAVLYKEPLLAPGADGLKTVEFINACILSGKTGKPVKIPVGRKKYEKLMTALKERSVEKHVETKRVTDPKFTV